MLPDVGKYTMVFQNIGPAVAGSAGPVPPPLLHKDESLRRSRPLVVC